MPEGRAAFDDVLRALARAPSVRPADLDLEGRRIGRYAALRRLGQGGMGVVYEALDTVLGRKVALKVLRASERDRGATRARLHEEARRIAALAHPHIATVYDVGEHDGIVFLALERAGGQSLRARLSAQPPIALPRAVAILRAVASALACAHDAGIVHRDLKPENVVVGDGGTIKIIDFGIATLTGKGAGPAGTRRYMAPEQAAGVPASARADVFAFGVLAIELLAASVVRAGDRGLQAALRRLAVACSAEDPDARPCDGAALVLALDTIAGPSQRMSRARLVAMGAAAAAIGVAAARLSPAPPAEASGAPASHTPLAAAGAARWQEVPLAAWGKDRARDRSRPSGPAPQRLRYDAGATAGDPMDREEADDAAEMAEGVLVAVDGLRPDGIDAPAQSELPVTAFVDARGRLVVNLDRYTAPVGAMSGHALANGRLAPIVAEPRAKMLVDGKGGAVIQVTLAIPKASGRGSGGEPGAAAVAGPSERGNVVTPGVSTTQSVMPSRGASSNDGPSLFDSIGHQGEPGITPPAHGSGAGRKSAPVLHYFCTERMPEGLHMVIGEGGELELMTGGDGVDDAESVILAVIDVTGDVVEIGEGVTMCGAMGEPLITFDG